MLEICGGRPPSCSGLVAVARLIAWCSRARQPLCVGGGRVPVADRKDIGPFGTIIDYNNLDYKNRLYNLVYKNNVGMFGGQII